MREIGEIVRLQSVLVLSAAHAPAHAEILNGLQVKSGAGNLCGFRADPGNHLIGAEFAFAERLKLAKHARGTSPAAATGEGSDGVDGRILENYVREVAHLLGHGGKRQVLITLDDAGEAAGVLLREKSHRSPGHKEDIQTNGADREQEDEELMAEHPTQRNVIDTHEAIEGILRK